MHSYFKINQDPKDFYEFLKNWPSSPDKGIYQLYWLENKGPKTINRLYGQDKEGILYIGMTEGKLLKRVSDLQQALKSNSDKALVSPTSSGHTQMGMKYYRIRKKVLIQDLSIKIFPHEDPKSEESIRLDNYVKAFGELPPLNGQYGSVSPDWNRF